MPNSTVFGLHSSPGIVPSKGSSYFRYYDDATKHFDRSRKSGRFQHLSLNVYTFKGSTTYYAMLTETDWPITAATIKSWSVNNA